ncbi:hypothetical protein [Oligoflexus tunisiensis]|uniref:hypothetical protein n=1 Tax=Oligoflexus tunisiensis TaxID=708132 RepID=UPI00114CB40F|nr:hypothetical protein [Oligoflexus tunisiensis]
MKRNTLISLALLTMMSGTAYSHQIFYAECDDSVSAEAARSEFTAKKTEELRAGPGGIIGSRGPSVSVDAVKCYSDQPEMQDLRSEHPNTPESDRVAAMTFCKMGGYKNPADCASDILNKGLADSARGCMDSAAAQVKKLAINPIAHQVDGGGPGTAGIWHQTYAHSKEVGWHRHDWSHEAQDYAGTKYAVAKVEFERKLRETNSWTVSSATTTGTDVGVNGTVGVSGGVASVEIGGSAGVNGSSEKGTSTEKGPLTQKEINAVREKYYQKAALSPWLQPGGYKPPLPCGAGQHFLLFFSQVVAITEAWQRKRLKFVSKIQRAPGISKRWRTR